MALSPWHAQLEFVLVLVPTLIIDPDDGPCDFAYPGEFLVLDGMSCYKATLSQLQTHYLPEPVFALGPKDFS